MSLQILISQSGAPVTPPGQAREDLVTGLPVQLEAIGGPFSKYLWTFISKPIDIAAEAFANSAFTASTSAVTLVDPVDVRGTYLVQVAVDSGQGLGATEDDVAQITFYAGDLATALQGALATDPGELPRRLMAYAEQLQHNVPDALQPTGNTEGWSREWYRIWDVLERMYQGKGWAHARVAIPGGGPASVVNGFNVATATWTATGTVDIVFVRPMQTADYSVIPVPIGAAGMAYADNITTTGFTLHRSDVGGTDADLDTAFVVHYALQP